MSSRQNVLDSYLTDSYSLANPRFEKSVSWRGDRLVGVDDCPAVVSLVGTVSYSQFLLFPGGSWSPVSERAFVDCPGTFQLRRPADVTFAALWRASHLRLSHATRTRDETADAGAGYITEIGEPCVHLSYHFYHKDAAGSYLLNAPSSLSWVLPSVSPDDRV
ncbi:hypothetical protein FA95DRAFT_1612571 [Auriscalpium vulgare]|uniref:Uncharacterized protein n=1 Tax=Auriscalpium vulgare TaxID=40419 RepID=A0ACB8R6E2_9AGAM|nr:hypothetical protein FA95DRAFT_1612571 [Auriscalpium vulgare]